MGGQMGDEEREGDKVRVGGEIGLCGALCWLTESRPRRQNCHGPPGNTAQQDPARQGVGVANHIDVKFRRIAVKGLVP